ncbi:MAG: Na+/H+ antiporter subunit E [Planctomycetes bacterium]|nr:Na+/H+ antiporter subunit E [Planctomycetota bacterium]MCA8946942.1 Na+/H+ antiporter subunit E [Planctomycetota bacterium]
MLRHLILFVVLCGFWAALSGQLDWTVPSQRYLMGCGLVSCALTTLLMWRVGFLEKEGNFVMIALRQPPYLLWLLWQIIISNWDVAVRVWKPKLDVDPSMIKTSYSLKSELAVAIFANSITLTPGTVTVDIDSKNKEFLVHQLSSTGEDGLKSMHDKVAKLEGREAAE